MRVLDIALKDLLQIARERSAALFLVIMPVIFTIVFGFAFGGFGGNEEVDPRLPVGYLDEDQGALSEPLHTLLRQSQVIRLVEEGDGRSELERAVADDELAGAVFVPAGYGQALLAGETRPLEIVVDSGSNAAITIRGEIQAAAMRLASAAGAAGLEAELYDREVGFGSPDEAESTLSRSLNQAVTAWEEPPITVAASKATANAEGDEDENAFAQSSPGMMAQFAIAGLMGAATIMVVERKSGSLRRLLTTNIGRPAILAGHYLAMFVMILVQLVVLALFGQLLLRLDYFGQPAAATLIIVATALFGASLGLLIGALARKEEQVIVFALVLMFVLAGLGGAWVPLEVMPAGVQSLARLTPLAWVMTGFQDIVVRGLGTVAVVQSTLVLLGYAAVVFVLAAWRFRFE